jgi:aspartokinase-like uncharacterized kinase
VPRPDAVLKIGGSLGRRPAALRRLLRRLAALARTRVLVVVPGGGAFADAVRRADARLGLGDSAAHWMAILAMDQSAYALARLAPGTVIRGPRAIRPGRLNVLAPSAWLLRRDPLPHSWDVTSDAIAAWVAGAVRARRLVLVKAVDGFLPPGRGRRAPLPRVARRRLRGVVDRYFARVLPAGLSCWIVNGRHPERVIRAVETGRAYGTEVR